MSVNYSLTKAGLDLMALGQTGKEIRFTSIVLGDGVLAEGQSPAEMTALVNEVMALPINFCQAPGNGTVKIGAPFSNADLEVGFLYRELGAKAIHPDTGEEVLYCCGNAGDGAEWVGPYSTPKLIEKQIYINTVVGNAANVTAVIDSELALSREALDQHDADPGTHAAAIAAHDTSSTAHAAAIAAHNSAGDTHPDIRALIEAGQGVDEAVTAHNNDASAHTEKFTSVEESLKTLSESKANQEDLDAVKSTAEAAMPKTGGTFTGNVMSNNPAVGTVAVRNIYAGTGTISSLTTGVIYLKYE